MSDLIINGIDYGKQLDIALFKIKFRIEFAIKMHNNDIIYVHSGIITPQRNPHTLTLKKIIEIHDKMEEEKDKNLMSGHSLNVAMMNQSLYGCADPDMPGISSKKLAEIYDMVKPTSDVSIPRFGSIILTGTDHRSKNNSWLYEEFKKNKEI